MRGAFYSSGWGWAVVDHSLHIRSREQDLSLGGQKTMAVVDHSLHLRSEEQDLSLKARKLLLGKVNCDRGEVNCN